MAQKVLIDTGEKPDKKAPKESADEIILPHKRHHSKLAIAFFIGLALVIITAGSVVFVRISYADKVFPGVRAQGVYIGGFTKAAAIDALNKSTAGVAKKQLIIKAGDTTVAVSPEELGATYNNEAAVDSALAVGKTGSIVSSLVTQVSYMVGHGDKNIVSVAVDGKKAAALYAKVNKATAFGVANASLDYSGDSPTVAGQQTGKRVDIATFYATLYDNLTAPSAKAIETPTYAVAPVVANAQVARLVPAAKDYVSTPLELTYAQKKWVANKAKIISWLNIAGAAAPKVDPINNFYVYAPPVSLGVDQTAIRLYLNELAKEVDVEAVDAQLTVVGGKATVFAQSQDGATLQVDKSITEISDALAKKASSARSVALVVDVKKALVRDDTINDLGITDLLSEGVTFFPGSSANRRTNVFVGQSQFDGVLIKPGEIFSFGKQMGPVGPEQGYKPGLVILDNHEEKQYGGGMCQVSSTLFRAALLAGLPIIERHNHAFAVSFYTAPYGIPGVDATIFYPGTDLKIENDTGHYILIQTEFSGSTLKFRLYGTKAKEGQIRGPNFIEGTNDATKPSTTVFYRDILVGGKVVSTDKFTTHYKSSLDFPITAD